MKTCTKCGETKPFEDFYKRAKSNDGLMSWCKDCAKAHDLARNAAPERKAMRANSKRANYAPVKATNTAKRANVKADLLAATSKACKKCSQKKPIDSYTIDVRYADGHYPWCAECRSGWRKGRVERQLQQQRAWRRINLDRSREQGRANYHKHKDRIAPKRRAYDRNRYHSDPDYRRRKDIQTAEKNRRRRALLYGIDTAHHTEQEWLDLCAYYDHRCLCCGEQKPLSRDHVVPVTSGGLDTIENIQPLCKVCNSRKNNRMIDYRKGKP